MLWVLNYHTGARKKKQDFLGSRLRDAMLFKCFLRIHMLEM